MNGDSLDTLIDRICDPSRSWPGNEDWRSINQLTELVNSEDDGPATALRLTVEKLQSTTNAIGILALETIERCVRNCGRRFHDELGKFRFLNELIKLISPKFAAQRTPDGVKARIKRLLHDWSTGLPQQPKIKEAYEMLRRQGIITDGDVPKPEVVKRGPQMASFEDENRSALLARLLKSKHPEDLEAANRLIKDMVRQDEAKMTKLTNRLSDLEVWQNNIKLLTEMLAHYDPSVSNDVLVEIHRACQEMRPKLFKLVQEMDEGDDGLGDILQVNDDLSKVLELYDDIVIKGHRPPVASAPVLADAAAAAPLTAAAPSSDGQLLDLMGGMTSVGSREPARAAPYGDEPSLLDLDPFIGGQPLAPGPSSLSAGAAAPSGSLLDDLASLDPFLAPAAGPAMPSTTTSQPTQLGGTGTPFSAQPSQALLAGGTVLGAGVAPAPQMPLAQPVAQPILDLGSIVVPVNAIQMSSQPPVSAYDRNGLRIVLYTTQNSPAPGVLVFVVSVMSVNTSPVQNFVFQAAVPKTMRVKLQPASGSDLPAYNPLAAPATISQIMLVANATPDPLRLRYKVAYTMNGLPVSDMGEVDNLK